MAPLDLWTMFHAWSCWDPLAVWDEPSSSTAMSIQCSIRWSIRHGHLRLCWRTLEPVPSGPRKALPGAMAWENRQLRVQYNSILEKLLKLKDYADEIPNPNAIASGSLFDLYIHPCASPDCRMFRKPGKWLESKLNWKGVPRTVPILILTYKVSVYVVKMREWHSWEGQNPKCQ